MSESEPKPTPEIVSAAEVLGPPEPGKAKKFALTVLSVVFVAVMGALGDVVQEHSYEIVQLVLAFLPAALQGYVGAAVASAVSALGLWLKARAAKRQREKVIEALATPPPDDIKKYYK